MGRPKTRTVTLRDLATVMGDASGAERATLAPHLEVPMERVVIYHNPG